MLMLASFNAADAPELAMVSAYDALWKAALPEVAIDAACDRLFIP